MVSCTRYVSWLTTPTSVVRVRRLSRRRSRPSIVTTPEVGSCSRSAKAASVDLPDPVSPTTASVAPGGMVKLTPRSASRSASG